jgi:hypothetical protein
MGTNERNLTLMRRYPEPSESHDIFPLILVVTVDVAVVVTVGWPAAPLGCPRRAVDKLISTHAA